MMISSTQKIAAVLASSLLKELKNINIPAKLNK